MTIGADRESKLAHTYRRQGWGNTMSKSVRTLTLATLVAVCLSSALVATVLGATPLQQATPIAWDAYQTNCNGPDARDLDPGQVLWHFVLSGPTNPSATLTTKFKNAGTVRVGVASSEGNNAHFLVVTGLPDTLLAAQTDVDGQRLDLSHVCGLPMPDGFPTPSPQPTAKPTAKPTPTPAPTPKPTPKPSAKPTPTPTPKPQTAPTAKPTPAPTPKATPKPTPAPTPKPTPKPTPAPTPKPQTAPTAKPTPKPTPTATPNAARQPSADPTPAATGEPLGSTSVPSSSPTPTSTPTRTLAPAPTSAPAATVEPTAEATANPTDEGTANPTAEPTASPEPLPAAVVSSVGGPPAAESELDLGLLLPLVGGGLGMGGVILFFLHRAVRRGPLQRVLY